MIIFTLFDNQNNFRGNFQHLETIINLIETKYPGYLIRIEIDKSKNSFRIHLSTEEPDHVHYYIITNELN